MPAITRETPSVFAMYTATPLATGPIVVASDTSPQSDAVFPLANALASHTQCPVQVISAIRSVAMPLYPFDAMPIPLETDNAVRAGREGMIKQQMERLVSSKTAWPVTVKTGEPAHDIVGFAKSLDARVILVGRGRHAALQRALGGETVLRLLQLGDCPVLAVESKLTSLPMRVVIATDFSEFSLHAAQIAMTLVAPNANVQLVHVAPPFAETDPVLQARAIAYRNQAHHAFSQLHDRLAHDAVTFTDVLVNGNPSVEIMKIIRDANADLVVTATHGYGFLRRMILGSVAAELVRHAPCSVLCVPGSAQTLASARTHTGATVLTRVFDFDVLDAELKAFGDRNTGRRCTLEIDAHEIGAQILGHSLPLVGATYDRLSRTVSLMFGASVLAGYHLTHVIPGVTAVSAKTDGAGRDQVLCITHPGGHTLMLLD